GGEFVQDTLGFDGSDVNVAVLDSGIDYTHANMGGAGTLAAYEAAYGTDPSDTRNTTRDGLFPTSKVVDGFDFVGEVWPNGPLAPDDDPIDFEGHGSHVADIIGGTNGVAPGVNLYAVKVCSAVSSSCSGVALIQGMEFAVDPNGDGDPADAVDVINMSLGSVYGQAFDDDLSLAVENATALGVLTVASAGNSSDKPYITGTPSASPSALAVAQTQVPSAFTQFMEVIEPAADAGNYTAVFQPWSGALTSTIAGPVTYGDGAGGNLNGCAPFLPGSLSGIVFVDRGACSFTTKIFNIENGGGSLGIIGLIAPGAPFPGGAGTNDPITIPGFMISQADGDILRTGAAVASFDPTNGLPLVMSLVGSSSRGPGNFGAENLLKPEIGAPGASVSLEAGTGTGETPFGGTSGAAPMVAGSAALLLEANSDLTPLEVKALLMNNGERDILNTVPGDLASITRIGGGEVRVNDAATSSIAAWDADAPSGGLGFGFVDVSKHKLLKKRVKVRNYSRYFKILLVKPTFRFQDDEDSGAVRVFAPYLVFLPGRSTRTIPVKLLINPDKLPVNQMSSGDAGGDPSTLTVNEYDGYLEFKSLFGGEQIAMPWHVLPRKAAKTKVFNVQDNGDGTSTAHVFNKGAGDAQLNAYALLATSPDIPRGEQGQQSPTPDFRAVGVTTIPVPAGFCSASDSFIWSFAINTWERQTHLLPVSHFVQLDVDQDGVDDFIILNRDLSVFSSGALNTIDDGRQVAVAFDLVTGNISASFFAEHATNTGNTVLNICAEDIGMSFADLLTNTVDVSFVAQDFYFGGPGDSIDGVTITPLGERFFAVPDDVLGRSFGNFDITDFGVFPGNTDELGVLLLTNGDRGAGNNRGGATQGTEALLLEFPFGADDDDDDDDDSDD
ncbi:MAG: S8 family serine peptidase, partial [Gammaproteobacteria bacterium]|nr:S8 family serine peptidase [Gammaproteobacteria bacterium]